MKIGVDFCTRPFDFDGWIVALKKREFKELRGEQARYFRERAIVTVVNMQNVILETSIDPPGRVYPSLPGALGVVPKHIAENAPFDVASTFAPVDMTENAAPLYLDLDALFQFLPEQMEPCIVPAERLARGKRAKERRARTTFLQSLDQRKVTRAERAEVVAEYREAFQKLAHAQQRSRCVFEGPIGLAPFSAPHAFAARAASQLLDWRLEIDLVEGRIEAAIDDLSLALRLARDLRPRGNLIAQLVATAIEASAIRVRLPLILGHPQVQIADCDRLLEVVSQHVADGVDPLVEGLQFEYTCMRDIFHRLELKEDLSDAMGMPGASFGTILESSARRMGRESDLASRVDRALAGMSAADFADEVECLNCYFGPFLERARRLDRNIDDFLPHLEQTLPPSKLFRYLIAEFPACLEAFRRGRVRSGAAQCLIALRRWKLIFDRDAPPDLATLCQSAEMSEVPADEYCGEPLRSTILDGEFVIYSVGPDRKDDQARIEWQPHQNRDVGDWIFRLPPSG